MMVETSTRPIPIPSPETQPFWDGCARGELLLQRCRGCGTVWHPPSSLCPSCLSTDYEWSPASGQGTVYTYSVVHHAFRPVWESLTPYVVAVIELAEGPHMVSSVIDVPPDSMEVGMGVTVVFQRISEAISLPFFKPVAGEK